MNHIARSLKTGDTSASDASPWPGRLEDDPLVRGQGRFIEDVLPDGAAFACFVRAPHAFATIRKCDAGAAKAAPLVLGVFTGADLAGLGTVTAANPQPGRTGGQTISPHRPALVAGRVVHVGESVALIVAETLAAAQDAAELVEIDYEPHKAIIGARSAIAAGAASIWPEAPDNVALDWNPPANPDAAKIVEIFANAAHVTRLELPNQRIAFASLEPRGAVASFDSQSQCFTLRVCSQGVSPIRNQAAAALHVKAEQVRVLTEDVGGGFGGKSMSYPEYVAILFAARALARPVRWMSGRGEAFLSDNQARDTSSFAELALAADGRFLALRIDHVADMGAYLSAVSAFIQTSNFANCLPSIYDIPAVSLRVRCVFTNTVPVAPYRGAGRPEANFVIERLIDEAARETGRDPALLRKRNLIKPKQIPYTNAGGGVYDSGDFPAMFSKALEAADHKGFASRKKKSARARLLRGFGIGCYLEIAGGVPEEISSIRFPEANKIEVSMGSGPSGQGQLSVFTRVAAKRLQLDEKAVTLLFGDSSRDVFGIGAIGSRSAMLVAGAIVNVIDVMLAKAQKLAAMLLQAGETEIDYHDGVFTVRESGRKIALLALAERATELARQGTVSESLDTSATLKVKSSFPNGCHIAEIEIDPETGVLTLKAYTAIDDCGNVLDAVIVEGQVHGAVAQGLGQALMEAIVFDIDGQVVTGSFMDYAIPRADLSPNIQAHHHVVPCTTNPLGTKGTGEAGSTAAPAAIINAILDALPQAAHPHITMPATSEKIWRALQFANNAALS